MQFQFSSHERRLIHQRSSEANEKVEQAVAVLEDVDKADKWESAYDVLEQSEMTPEERKEIDKNLRERAIDMSQEHRDRLSIIIGPVIPEDEPVEDKKEAKSPEAVATDSSKEQTPEAQPVPAEELSKWQRTKNWTGEKADKIVSWVKENPGKTTLAVTATLGALGLVVWLRNRKKGERSGLPWWVWVPGVGALGYGLYKGYGWLKKNSDWFNNAASALEKKVDESIPKEAKDIADKSAGVATGTYEGIQEGSTKVGELWSENFEGADLSHTRAVEKNRDSYQSNLEYNAAWVGAFMLDGGEVVIFNGVPYLFNSGKHLVVDRIPALGAACLEAIENPDKFNLKEVARVWVGGTAVYASSVGALELFFLRSDVGLKRGAWEVTKRSIRWPYEVLWNKSGKYAIGIISPGAKGRVVRSEIKVFAKRYPYRFNRARYALVGSTGLKGGWTEPRLEVLWEEWQSYRRIAANLRGHDGAELIQKTIDRRLGNIERQMRKGVATLWKKQKIIPEFIRNIGEGNVVHQIKAGYRSMSPSYFSEKLESAYNNIANKVDEIAEVVPDSAASGSASKPKPKPDPDAAPKPKPRPRPKGPDTFDDGGPVKNPKPKPAPEAKGPELKIFDPDSKLGAGAADEVADVAKGNRLEQMLARSGASDEVIDALRVSGFDLSENLARVANESPEFASAVAKFISNDPNPAAKVKLLNEAFTGIVDPKQATRMAKILSDERKVARALSVAEKGGDVAKSFSKMAKIGKVLNALGVVGDAVAIYATVYEIAETKKLIENTDNEELKSQYQQRYFYHTAELGVAGTGLVTFGAGVAGVGGAIATPVAIATIPVSVVIYGAYEGHKWQEDKTRTSEDWAKERGLVDLITDTRYYGFGERVGHNWDVSMGNGRWLRSMVPGLQMYHLFSGNLELDINQLKEDIKNVNHEKIEAIVAHTTTVSVPEKMLGEDGKPRNLTNVEIANYKNELSVYVKNKTDFIIKQSQDIFHAISSGADVRELMENAEYYALRAKDEPKLRQELIEARERNDLDSIKTLEDLLDDDASEQELAVRYKKYNRKKHIEGLYTQFLGQAILSEAGIESAKEPLEGAIVQELQKRAEPVIIEFRVRCKEDNFVDWWIDGGESQELLAYLTGEYEHILKTQSASIASTMSERIGEQTNEDEVKMPPIIQFEQLLKDAEQEIKDNFLGQSPRSMFNNLKEDAKKYDRVKEVLSKQERLRQKRELISSLDKKLVPHTHADYNTTNQKMWRRMKRMFVQEKVILEDWLSRNTIRLES